MTARKELIGRRLPCVGLAQPLSGISIISKNESLPASSFPSLIALWTRTLHTCGFREILPPSGLKSLAPPRIQC